MRRFIFAAVVLGVLPRAARSQPVPARDLLDFRLGTLAEVPALASLTGDGLWNPATTALPGGTLLRAAASALTTSAEQGVRAQGISIGTSVPGATTLSLSVLRVAVRDIIRTETDPQTVGGEVPYGTTLVSAIVARRHRLGDAGVALRFRTGTLDQASRLGLAVDAGVASRGLGPRDVRLAASTFLWAPGADGDERPALLAGTDLRLAGPDTTRELRGAYGVIVTEALGREHYLALAGRSGRVAGRAGLVRSTTYGVVTRALRLGLGLHYARYVVGLAREETTTGIPPSYQFTLGTSFQ